MKKEKITHGHFDFHAHILPGADHGSRSMETSLAQLKLLSDAELAAVVATPHFYAHEERSAAAFLEKRRASAEALKAAAGEAPHPALYLGAEVLVCPGLDRMEELSRLCIEGTKIMLLEMPFTDWGRELMETVENIAEQGIVPLMAHIDRYSDRQRALLLDYEGIYFQVNASALCLPFVRHTYRRLAKWGVFSAIGSDLHGTPGGGYREFERALAYIGPAADGIRASSRAMLDGATPFLTSNII